MTIAEQIAAAVSPVAQSADAALASAVQTAQAAMAQVTSLTAQVASLQVGPSFVPAGTDLAPLVNGAAAGANLYLGDGPYTQSPAKVSTAGVSLVGNGRTRIACTVPQGASSVLTAAAPDFRATGINWSGVGVLFHVLADRFCLDHSTTADGLIQAIKVDGPGNDGFVACCKFGKTSSATAYLTYDGWTLVRNDFAGSTDEHCIRIDVSPDGTLHRPRGTMIFGGSVKSIQGKEAITVRVGDDVFIYGVRCSGWMRFAEAVATSPVQNVTGLLVRRCIFDQLRNGNVLLDIKQGVSGEIGGNWLLSDSAPMTCDVQTDLRLPSNIIVPINPLVKPRLCGGAGHPVETNTTYAAALPAA